MSISETSASETSADLVRDKRVLCVDDSRAIRAFLSTLLGAGGATVDEAGTGEEAIARHAASQYDLILLDILLPDIDGLDVLRRMRERDQDSTIVVLTGVGGVTSATQAMQRGADGYVEKQYLTGRQGEPEFFYALKQALEHRAGFVAQRQLHQLRTEFYSMVTHDLRNPAGTVLGLIKLVLAGKGGALTLRQEELLGVAKGAAEKLTSLITNYLDYEKIDAGYLTLTTAPADIREIVRRSAQQAEVQASAKGQTLTLHLPDAPLCGTVDANKLEQVFDNLISNAVKYTPDGGAITVSLRRDADSAIGSVTDTGRGIPPELLTTLFTKYTRIPGGDGKKEQVGTGLGLVIVKEIVQAHGGAVTAYSAGRGATFTVRIPLAA